jgi:hypothetical protein
VKCDRRGIGIHLFRLLTQRFKMGPSDSEDDNLEDLEYDGDDDPDVDVDDELLDGGADDATEADDVCLPKWDCRLLVLIALSPCW